MTDGLHGDYRSDVWDEKGKLDVSLFQSALDSTPICIELPSDWLNIISGLLDIFRSTRYLEGTDSQIVEFQVQVDEIQQKIALMESCASAMIDCNDIEQCLSSSTIIQNIITDIENSYTSIVNTYNRTETIVNNITNADSDNYSPALIWENRFFQRYDNNAPIVIPIEDGYKAFRLRIHGTSSDGTPKPLYCYINGDLVGSNYYGWDEGYDLTIANPVIGRLMPLGSYASINLETTMYDYSRNSYGKVMYGNYFALNSTTATRYAHTAGFYYAQSADVTQINIVPFGSSYQTIEVSIDYLSEVLVSVSKPYDPPPPPPPPLLSTGIIDLITFNPADSGVFTTNFGQVVSDGGNPDYHLYLEQAPFQPVPFSLDCTVTLPEVRNVTKIHFDYKVWNGDIVGDMPVHIRVELLDIADNVLQTSDYNDPLAPQLVWQTGELIVSQTGVKKVEFTFFGYGSPDTEPYELFLDNLKVFSE